MEKANADQHCVAPHLSFFVPDVKWNKEMKGEEEMKSEMKRQ